MPKPYHIFVDDAAAKLYELVAQNADRSPEQVMSDALFQYAGQLARAGIQSWNQKCTSS